MNFSSLEVAVVVVVVVVVVVTPEGPVALSEVSFAAATTRNSSKCVCIIE